ERFLLRDTQDGPRTSIQLQQLGGGDDVPQRGVDRVELRGGAAIRESVWQHAFRHRTSPLDQNVARLAQPPGGQAQAPYRNERVPAPVREPRVAGDDGAPLAALNDVRICRPIEWRRKRLTPTSLGRARVGRERQHIVRSLLLNGGAGPQNPDRVITRSRERPTELTRRREIFGVVEAALPLSC